MLLDLISYNEVSDSLLKRKRNCFCFCFFDNAYFDSFIVSILVDIFSIVSFVYKRLNCERRNNCCFRHSIFSKLLQS